MPNNRYYNWQVGSCDSWFLSCLKDQVAETVNFGHIKTRYYDSHTTINSSGIVPKVPKLNFRRDHNHDGLTKREEFIDKSSIIVEYLKSTFIVLSGIIVLKIYFFSIFSILFGVVLSSEPVLASPSDLNSAAVFSSSNANAELPVLIPENFTDTTTGMQFVLIKGGCFQMGSPSSEEGRGADEGPRHEVCLDDFWMGQYEVTNSQYHLYDADHDSRAYLGHDLNGEMQPVVYINWQSASDYATWLSRQSTHTFRLPTEAEWEYAARGLTTSSRFWGEDQVDACDYANVGDQAAKQDSIGQNPHNCTDGVSVSANVGFFKPNAYGLYDILGNVWEWTGDWYAETYHDSSQKLYRVLRGGSWFSDPRNIRVARRSWYRPDSHNNSLGFRLVFSVK